MMNQLATREAAKTALRDALKIYDGDVKQAEVKGKIEQLCQLNPIVAPSHSHRLESKEWLLISAPSFPQGEKLPNGKYAYTLGRLAFNMFEPTNLKLVIDAVRQPVVLLGEGEKRSHDIVVEFTIIDEYFPSLKGVVKNLGVCYPADNQTLQVQFTGGSLAPQNKENLDQWKTIFSQAKPAQKSLKEQLMSLFLKVMFGLVPPTGMNTETGEIDFKMKRSPKGSLAVLYLDEELRITRGEKGTILVCERMK
ncbi:PAP/fibrillin family protein [Crocosphaera sp. UHCC 0190]|uniref:PAP/fibrillin family protein n=1 Tax=Crocosphaera sp. UHCC 0190 TaxID=3110246 RepID=UPI002B220C8E|nr:PAP/fibrillin family protein [Crocosphaera sp. UHCC 0190]MEA5510133.1 PAP/fibrillin family protein [Crocosphaera sp. UHCC 0190]